MAITSGVVEMIWESEAICVYVTSMTSSELLTLEFASGRPLHDRHGCSPISWPRVHERA